MNKTEFIAAVAKKADITKSEAQKVVNAVLEVVTEALKNGEKVVLTGFGSFEVRHAKERYGVNPRTKERVLIPATKRPAFSPGAELKKAVAPK
jgi:DNA-binding protein HU-beta